MENPKLAAALDVVVDNIKSDQFYYDLWNKGISFIFSEELRNSMPDHNHDFIAGISTRDTSVTYNYPGVSQDSAQSACSTLNAAYQASLGAGSADCRLDY